jgi:hypothetical protein
LCRNSASPADKSDLIPFRSRIYRELSLGYSVFWSTPREWYLRPDGTWCAPAFGKTRLLQPYPTCPFELRSGRYQRQNYIFIRTKLPATAPSPRNNSQEVRLSYRRHRSRKLKPVDYLGWAKWSLPMSS